MEHMQGSRDTTPKSHPTYGVRLSNEEIGCILECLIPGCDVLDINRLASGKSFNNRIYFLKVYVPKGLPLRGLNEGTVNDLVLKLNGRFFDQSKSENEVSCLSLLDAFVPEIPCPRVIAWSDSQSSIVHRLAPNGALSRCELRLGSEISGQYRGWILMTRVPGIPLSTLSLSAEELKTIGEQLADLVFRWREGLPAWTVAGNFECTITHEKSQCLNCIEISGLRIRPSSNMPGFGIRTTEAIINELQYYRVKLKTRLQTLQELEVFERNRHLIDPIREFITVRLPQLEMCNRQSPFVFTHYDLAPRNLLISVETAQITGIVDFEFSGVFPEFDEYVESGNEFPDEFYKAYLDRLEEHGLRTPRKGIEEQLWKEVLALSQLEEHIAPWWLENSENLAEDEKIELLEGLRKSENLVLEAMQVLGQSS